MKFNFTEQELKLLKYNSIWNVKKRNKNYIKPTNLSGNKIAKMECFSKEPAS